MVKNWIFPHGKNLASFWGRKIFERRQSRKLIGAGFLAALFLVVTFPSSTWALALFGAAPLQESEITLTTEVSRRFPVNGSLSQGFSFAHPGWDLTAPLGESVYPLMAGVVAEMGEEFKGYGRYLILDHGSGFQTLYGHLLEIKVAVGEEVTKETMIGEVGETGRTTGVHLHFEIWQDSQPFNPGEVLGD